jgi:DNA-binding transcriptional LysR family regulator
VARADRVLAELAAAEAELAAEHGAVRGEVVVGAFPSAGSHLVVPAVGALAAFGDLTVSVREHEPEDGIGLLRSGELDLLISESYDDVPPAPVGGLEQRLLVSEELLLVVTAEHDGALSALSTADWVGGVAGTQYAAAVERACANAGFAPRIQHRADDATLIQALTAARLGVALLPELACTPYEGVRYVSASPAPPRRNVAALLRTGAARRPAVAAVLDALTAALLARSRRARTSAP